MRTRILSIASILSVMALAIFCVSEVHAQSFGVELHNTLMPVSGAMGGVSIASPKDPVSAINGNPASLTQYEGINFSFGGGWIEPTFNLRHTGSDVIPNVEPYQGKSEQQGSLLGNIGFTYDMRPLGLPATFGVGLVSAAGAGVSFNGIPESNGSSASLTVLKILPAVGVQLTDQVSVGASMALGSSGMNAPFIGIRSFSTDYALRGKLGVNYEVTCGNRIGLYWETEQSYRFDDAVRLQLPNDTFLPALDLSMDLPQNFGIGFATDNLLCGKLHLGVDVLYKQWSEAALFAALYEDQWVFQAGAQYELNPRIKLRLGYVFAEDIMIANPGINIGGISPPGATDALQYVQGILPAINKHRITGGIGIKDLLPGMDFDLFAGGMFKNTEQFGTYTTTSLQSYWVGAGMTFQFGHGQAATSNECVSCF
ncbi:MAG: hypothetical protein COA78_20945 [Blastopirellula sp.]|nr:MAG: hypothetical protein COA78_20945 [Blastopirellula sp.]